MPTFDRVAAAWSKHGDDAIFKYDDLDALVIGGPVHARLRFTSHAAPDCFTLTVRGTRGWAETDLFQPHCAGGRAAKGRAQLSPLVNQFANGTTLMRSSFSGFVIRYCRRRPTKGCGRSWIRPMMRCDRAGEPPVTFDDMDRASRLIEALLDEANFVKSAGERLHDPNAQGLYARSE